MWDALRVPEQTEGPAAASMVHRRPQGGGHQVRGEAGGKGPVETLPAECVDNSREIEPTGGGRRSDAVGLPALVVSGDR